MYRIKFRNYFFSNILQMPYLSCTLACVSFMQHVSQPFPKLMFSIVVIGIFTVTFILDETNSAVLQICAHLLSLPQSNFEQSEKIKKWANLIFQLLRLLQELQVR